MLFKKKEKVVFILNCFIKYRNIIEFNLRLYYDLYHGRLEPIIKLHYLDSFFKIKLISRPLKPNTHSTTKTKIKFKTNVEIFLPVSS